MEAFEKTIRPGTVKVYEDNTASVYCKITWSAGDEGKLSITGIIGPTPGGDAIGGGGQISQRLLDQEWNKFAPEWDEDVLEEFCNLWDRWHLNDMRAGCKYQRKMWDTRKEVEIVTYRLAREHRLAKCRAEKALEEAFEPVPEEYAESSNDKGLPTVYVPEHDRYECSEEEAELLYIPRKRTDLPEEGDPGYRMYVEDSRVTQSVSSIRPSEHPDGLLGKECPQCGYKYGSEWRYEPVPDEVLQWLKDLPDANRQPAWV